MVRLAFSSFEVACVAVETATLFGLQHSDLSLVITDHATTSLEHNHMAESGQPIEREAGSPITVRQKQWYDAIVDFWRREYRSPLIRELCEAMGSKSTNSATGHIKALLKHGYLVRGSGTHTARGLLPVVIRDHIDELKV